MYPRYYCYIRICRPYVGLIYNRFCYPTNILCLTARLKMSRMGRYIFIGV